MSQINLYRRSMSEAEMLAAIKAQTIYRGGTFLHIRDARKQDVRGFPDCLALVPIAGQEWDQRLVTLELKTQDDVIRDDQREWIERFERVVDVRAGIVRPAPRDGEIDLDLALWWLMGDVA